MGNSSPIEDPEVYAEITRILDELSEQEDAEMDAAYAAACAADPGYEERVRKELREVIAEYGEKGATDTHK